MYALAKTLMRLVAVGLLVSGGAYAQTSDGDLRIVSVDVEGGAAVLFHTPEGKSLLIDTGWEPGHCNRASLSNDQPKPPCPISADAIARAAAKLGITHLDYLFMTHYHPDHIGGLNALLSKLSVDTFVDHGPNREFLPADAPSQARTNSAEAGYARWQAATEGHHHIIASVGEVMNIGSLHIQFVAADGKIQDSPLPSGGQANALCAGVPDHSLDGEENVRSLGMLMSFGKTRIIYLGDLTWNMELKLLCPTNKIGNADIYFVTGHGMDLSSSPPTAAFDPLVAVMQNGPTKGGDEAAIKTVEGYPNLDGFWRTHYSVRYPELNGDPNYIGNLNVLPDRSYSIDLGISPAGKITVTNSRNGFSKTYTARGSR